MQTAMMIDEQEVERLLTPAVALVSVAEAMRAIYRKTAAAPPRLITDLEDVQGFFAAMPGALRDLAVFGAKLVSLLPDNAGKGLPVVQGVVVLFHSKTGAPIAFVDGGAVTAIRTAAASALATQQLAAPDADVLGLFGAGTQAASHVDAIRGVRRLREVLVWGRSQGRTTAFAERQSERTGLPFRVVDASTAAAAPIICTVTAAKTPILKGEWLAPGAHVNLVGAHAPASREIDSDGMAAGRLYVDSQEGALSEAGDLLIPMAEGRLTASHIVGDLGALLCGAVEGRQSPADITIFKSLGHVAQDLAAAHAVYRMALEHNNSLPS